jgi:hypothetical protein
MSDFSSFAEEASRSKNSRFLLYPSPVPEDRFGLAMQGSKASSAVRGEEVSITRTL